MGETSLTGDLGSSFTETDLRTQISVHKLFGSPSPNLVDLPSFLLRFNEKSLLGSPAAALTSVLPAARGH